MKDENGNEIVEVPSEETDDGLDEFGAIFNSRNATGEVTLPEEEEEVADDEEEEDDETTEEEDSTPEKFIFRGQELTSEQVEALLALDNQLKSDPKFVEHIGTYFNPPAPKQEESAPPVDDDLKEYLQVPAFKKLYDLHQTAINEIQQLKAEQSTVVTDLAERRRQENEGYVNAAIATFKEQFTVSQDELTRVRDAAAKMELVPVLMRGVDPITGQQFKPDPVSCIRRAMEIAYWQIPELRDREIQKQMEAKAQSTKRRKTSSALSGSGGSAPRTTAPPKNDVERRQAMINELASKFSG